MIPLPSLFDNLRQPSENEDFQFSAIAIPEYTNHRIAKDKSGNPTLLLSNVNETTRAMATNLRLQNVLVLYDVNCKIQQGEVPIEKCFTAVCYIGSNMSLKRYFLKLCSTLIEHLGNTPTQEDIRREITKFTELLRLAIEPQIKTIQGLWAELFLIAESKSPSHLIQYWHSIPEEKFDFNNGEERLEVKSSANENRTHSFSLDQLNSPTGTRTLIASLFVKQTSAGRSIDELVNQISNRLTSDIHYIEKLQMQVALTLGKAIQNSMSLRFDYEFAKDSLLFFNAEDIPRIDIKTILPYVSAVRFESNISAIQPTNIRGLPNNGSLFDSI